ncbi:UDP-glucose/GDP-mannose dehydrogenase family protein [Mycobacterium sp. MYCO198283]|uniref:UDP-glucose dehydrogenase family protein n=1 Tax=Mycobacterium sp. MYCO198283 TaxID=2883505 RepID=UPI001E38D1AD|nr:UDP-glucose/GDP-mannose dehydrogenase family protein [Mycobacterium sp. MYCO198283]MCG5431671.1 UDP-glucose/GDP-mannose dehydrogenase family protein [Mycobacterium sp. MYCO198283]
MDSVKLGVVGAGYVGLTSAVCLAHKGFDTVCVDANPDKVAALRRGEPVLDEPQLPERLRTGLDSGALRFEVDYQALTGCDVVFVCVPTPTTADGSADLSAVESAVRRLGEVLDDGAVVAMKSTVPVGTSRRVAGFLAARRIHTVSNPEFLREGHTIYDFEHPDRVVIGADDDTAARTVAALYAGDTDTVLFMSPESAEVAKYASNAFLAVKLSFVNSLAQLCAGVAADIGDVTACMGADPRIGDKFLAPGPGWGGSCLPKDTAALVNTGREFGVALREVEAARETNAAQAGRIIATLRRVLTRPLTEVRIGVLGLTFKAGTSDVRDSPALAVCTRLRGCGASVTAYDPRQDSVDRAALAAAGVSLAADAYVAAKEADAVVVLTEWPEFAELDWEVIGRDAPDAVVLDTRNVVGAARLTDSGLRYLGNGSPTGY